MSGTFTGRARLTGAGRPGLRVAAWRAVWGCLQNNRVYAARYRHLTTREINKLTPTQAQTVDRRGDPAPAVRRRRPPDRPGTRSSPPTAPEPGWRWLRRNAIRARPRRVARPQAGSGRAFRGIENPQVSRRSSQAAPSRRRHNPITRCRAQLRYRYAGTDDEPGDPAQPLTQTPHADDRVMRRAPRARAGHRPARRIRLPRVRRGSGVKGRPSGRSPQATRSALEAPEGRTGTFRAAPHPVIARHPLARIKRFAPSSHLTQNASR